MKKTLFLFCVFVLSVNPLVAFSQEKGALGAGLVLGEPVSLTGKYFINKFNAVDVGLGIGDKFSIYGDYLWQGWKAFPKPRQGVLAAHVGVGLKAELDDNGDLFGIRTIAGVNYWVKSVPVECFAQLIPFFKLSPDAEFSLQVAVGARYYFSGWN